MSKEKKQIEVPKDAKVFDFDPIIEVCGECSGVGLVKGVFGDRECALCKGTGRIIKTKTVIIDIKPFE